MILSLSGWCQDFHSTFNHRNCLIVTNQSNLKCYAHPLTLCWQQGHAYCTLEEEHVFAYRQQENVHTDIFSKAELSQPISVTGALLETKTAVQNARKRLLMLVLMGYSDLCTNWFISELFKYLRYMLITSLYMSNWSGFNEFLWALTLLLSSFHHLCRNHVDFTQKSLCFHVCLSSLWVLSLWN